MDKPRTFSPLEIAKMRVHRKLEGKPRKSRKQLLEKAKKVLAQKTGEGPKFQQLESREKFCGDKDK